MFILWIVATSFLLCWHFSICLTDIYDFNTGLLCWLCRWICTLVLHWARFFSFFKEIYSSVDNIPTHYMKKTLTRTQPNIRGLLIRDQQHNFNLVNILWDFYEMFAFPLDNHVPTHISLCWLVAWQCKVSNNHSTFIQLGRASDHSLKYRLEKRLPILFQSILYTFLRRIHMQSKCTAANLLEIS